MRAQHAPKTKPHPSRRAFKDCLPSVTRSLLNTLQKVIKASTHPLFDLKSPQLREHRATVARAAVHLDHLDTVSEPGGRRRRQAGDGGWAAGHRHGPMRPSSASGSRTQQQAPLGGWGATRCLPEDPTAGLWRGRARRSVNGTRGAFKKQWENQLPLKVSSLWGLIQPKIHRSYLHLSNLYIFYFKRKLE